jgi:hypothetical protein
MITDTMASNPAIHDKLLQDQRFDISENSKSELAQTQFFLVN